jgi:signal transduction histidine kinase
MVELAVRARKAEAEAEEARRHLEELAALHKMRLLFELTGGLIHDINNALATIWGNAELASRLTQETYLQDRLAAVCQATRDASEIARLLQDFIRSEPQPTPAPVEINQLIRDVMEITRPQWGDKEAERPQQYRCVADLRAPTLVWGCAPELREVLINLVFNALWAMPDGGTLTFRSWSAEGWVHLSVADTGVGMSPETQARIFDPFFTTRGADGTGLGLHIARTLVERQHGHITVESALGQGTTFHLALPSAPPVRC